MNRKYLCGWALCEIEARSIDSLVWLAILRALSSIDAYARCGANYQLNWALPNFNPMTENLYNHFLPSAPNDPFASGIWVGPSSKMSIYHWCLRWNKLHCFSRL